MDKAAAVKYDQSLPAPFVAAAGKGVLARRIKEIAAESGVHLVSDELLADTLIELGPGSFIPEDLYGIIAELLVFVRRLNNKR
jgi:type III secretion system FlhB-like substrate exporter